MKVSNPVVINALLAKNADVECAVAENAAFKVGDKVVMRDGRKGEVVSSAP